MSNVSVITIDKWTINLKEGITETITCDVNPSFLLNKQLQFEVANPNIITINQQVANMITVEGKNPGVTTIKVSSVENPTVTATINCTVTALELTSRLYTSNNSFSVFKGESMTVDCKIYPCYLLNNKLEITSSDETIVKVSKQVGSEVTLLATGFGDGTITVKSVADPSLIAEISVNVTENLEVPVVLQKTYDGKKVTVTLDSYRGNSKASPYAYDTLVDFGWDATNPVDLQVRSNKVTFEVPNYDTDYYIRLAYSNGTVTSNWVTDTVRATVKTQAEIDAELAETVQREGIRLTVTTGLLSSSSTTLYKAYFEGTNVTSVEYKLSFESEDVVHTIAYDSTKMQTSVEVQCPDDYGIYTIKARGLNTEGKSTLWIEEKFVASYGGVCVSDESFNIQGNAIFTVFEQNTIPDELESDTIKEPQPNLYSSLDGLVAERVAGFGEVFHCDPSKEHWGGANVGFDEKTTITHDDGSEHEWASILDANGGKHYIKMYDEWFINCYYLNSLCYENCLGNGEGGFAIYNNDPSFASIHQFDLIKRGNFAIAGVYHAIYGLLPVAGFKLLQDVKIYKEDGAEQTSLKRGNWIWFINRGTSTAKGGCPNPNNIGQMAINSYSNDASIREILTNWATGSDGKNNGIYFMDTYFNLGQSAYAIDTTHLSDRKISAQGDIANGYFNFNNYGIPALIWTGSKYAIRSSVDNTSNVGQDNVVGNMHQCYLLSTSTGEDISKSSAGTACLWGTVENTGLMGDLINKYTDRHRIEEFFYAKGFFDIQSVTDGYFVGKKSISLCTPEWRHTQNGTHIGTGGSEYVLDPNTQKALIKDDGSTDNSDNGMMNYENITGISNTVLSSFFPLIQYIAKRIRKKCVEATGSPLNLLNVVDGAFKSNFAIHNDPTNGVEINSVKSYKPLYGAKVLKDNTALYVQESTTSSTLVTAKNSNDQVVSLSAGDWVWFSEEYPPKIANLNQNCVSIIGYTKGTDTNGDPEGNVLIAPCYVDAGLDNVAKQEIDNSLLSKLSNILASDTTKKNENDASYAYSALNYNISTMANPNGDEPHLLYEDDYYGRVIENTLCYNNTANDLNVTMEDGTADKIKTGRLFTFIGEYLVANVKKSRIYYYSDTAKANKYGSLDTPAASLFDYYIMNSSTRTVTVDTGETYGILPLPTVTKIYTRYGEYYATTEVRDTALDAVLFDNNIAYKKKSAQFDIMNLPNYIANGGIDQVDDTVNGLNEVNEPLMEPVIPNWLAIEYYVYNSYEKIPVNNRVKGYVSLDFSLDYTGKIK